MCNSDQLDNNHHDNRVKEAAVSNENINNIPKKDGHQHHHHYSCKKEVTFSTPIIEHVHYFDGVTDEEYDNVWFRRMDYVEFVENELRRRELLTEIERRCSISNSNEEDAYSNGCSSTSKNNTSTIDNKKNDNEETEMKHIFTRRMVSRTLSSGPPRRRRLPRREKNELDVCQHFSHVAAANKKKQQQQQESTGSSTATVAVTATISGREASELKPEITTTAVPSSSSSSLSSSSSQTAGAKPQSSSAAVPGTQRSCSRNEPSSAISTMYHGSSPGNALTVS